MGGTLGDEVAVKYLASDKPFEKRLGVGEGDEGDSAGCAEMAMEELLCDTIWGVDAMVSTFSFP